MNRELENKGRWQPGLVTLLTFGLLVTVNIAVFSTADDTGARTRLYHAFHPRHWPAWYSLNCWLAFFGCVAIALLKRPDIQRALHRFYGSEFYLAFGQLVRGSGPYRFLLRRKSGKRFLRRFDRFGEKLEIERWPVYAKRLTLLLIALTIFQYSDFCDGPRYWIYGYGMRPWRFLDKHVFVPFYYIPLIDYHLTGKVTWRLFIAPVTALLLIAWLLKTASKAKKERGKNHG